MSSHTEVQAKHSAVTRLFSIPSPIGSADIVAQSVYAMDY